MKELNVDPQYLHNLATTQRSASADTRSAVTPTDDMAYRLWKTHGVYTVFGNLAIADAVKALNTASDAMARLCDNLATTLDKAAKNYTDADQYLRQDLDTQTRFA